MQRGKDILFRKLINISKRHLEKNYIIYLFLSLFIVIGIILGSILILKINTNNKSDLLPHFNYIFNYLENKNYTSIDIFKSSLFFNMKILLIIWILGFLNFGMLITPLIICFKGMSIGLTVGYFVKGFGFKGFLLSILGSLPNHLILVPIFLIVAAMSVIRSISCKCSKNSKLEIITLTDYAIILLLFFLIIFFTILLESFLVLISFKLIGI